MDANAVVQVWSWCRTVTLAVGVGAHRAVQRLRRCWRSLWCWSWRPLELLLRVLGLATAMFIALQLAQLSQSLATIAQAQAISGYAVMRSLQAHGARAAVAPPPPVLSPSPPSAIDAHRLESTTPAPGP